MENHHRLGSKQPKVAQAVILNHTLTKKRAFSPLFVTVDFKKCVVSIHVNAAGNGSKWLNETCWSVFTCSGQTESDKLAECLCESAIKNFLGRRIRTDMSDGDRDWEEDFYILRKSWCQAVLLIRLWWIL